MTLHFPPPPLPFLPLIFVLLFPSQLRETEVELQRLHNRIAEDRYEGRRWRVNGKGESGERGETRVKYKRTARFRLPCPPSSLSFLIPPSSSSLPLPLPLVHSHRTREYEERVHALSCELEDVRHRLQAAERQAMEPSPLLLQLQSDMSKMKVWQCTVENNTAPV